MTRWDEGRGGRAPGHGALTNGHRGVIHHESCLGPLAQGVQINSTIDECLEVETDEGFRTLKSTLREGGDVRTWPSRRPVAPQPDNCQKQFLPSLPVSPLPGPQVLTQGLNSIPMEQTASSCSFISWKQNPIFQEPQPPCHQLNVTGDSTLKTVVRLSNTRRHTTHRAAPLPLNPFFNLEPLNPQKQ